MSRDQAPRAEGLSAAGLKVAIVCSRWNEDVTSRLLQGAEAAFSALGATHVKVVRVPGAFELPAAARALMDSGYDAVAALGAVIRGDTPHFDYVCSTAAHGLSALSVSHRAGLGFGLVTTNTLEQAFDRAGGKAGNYGESAAQAAVEMAMLQRELLPRSGT